MSSSLFDRLDSLVEEFAEVESRLGDPEVLGDSKRLREESRRYAELGPIVAAHQRYRAVEEDLGAARELMTEADGDEREAMRQQVNELEAERDQLEADIKMLLLPRDPNEGKAVIMEIRGAEGGEEANLFARDLFEMYRAYATKKGWTLEVLSADESDLGGYNQITFSVSGDDAWSHLKHEGGPHRVQRVPVTESAGRVHTSSATVLVLPEAEEVDVHLDPADLQIDVYRSSGPGGQGVNTTDSAVRITHVPSGLVVAMQDERSQLQNRARAMMVLRSRLLQLEQDRHAATMSAERKAQVGGGGRSEKIRTYNFKENRLTDHRIGLTIYKLQAVLAGDLDDVIDALVADERARLLSSGS
ncbi:MAG: peptide chain release factor 1 [Acidimicrobiia bacterium]